MLSEPVGSNVARTKKTKRGHRPKSQHMNFSDSVLNSDDAKKETVASIAEDGHANGRAMPVVSQKAQSAPVLDRQCSCKLSGAADTRIVGAAPSLGCTRNGTYTPIPPIAIGDVYVELVRRTERYANRGRGNLESKHSQSKNKANGLSPVFSILPYPRGVTNTSNYCFMNAVVQALVFIPPFAQLALSAAEESQFCPTLAALGRWCLQYWKAGLTRLPMQPPRFPFTMDGRLTTGSKMGVDGSVQEDAQEFLQRFMETIQTELCQLEKELLRSSFHKDASSGGFPGEGSESLKGWTFVDGKGRYTLREHQDEDGTSLLLSSIFGGSVESRLKGKSRCKDFSSVVVERFFTLPVYIGFAEFCTLEEAIERTFAEEKVFDSERGKELHKVLKLNQLPEVLLIQLRRWATTAEGEVVKLSNTVSLRRTLIVPPSACTENHASAKSRTYRLLSVVAHRGEKVDRGHFVTYLACHAANPAVQTMPVSGPTTRNGNGAPARNCPEASTLILCDDSTISAVPLKSVERAETPYFMVYQRCH